MKNLMLVFCVFCACAAPQSTVKYVHTAPDSPAILATLGILRQITAIHDSKLSESQQLHAIYEVTGDDYNTEGEVDDPFDVE